MFAYKFSNSKEKNVISLIKAAKKYDFKLVLAGNMGTEKEFEVLKKAIGNNANIEVLGYISEEKKIELYKKLKCLLFLVL